MAGRCKDTHCDLCGHETHSVWDELLCHIPYACISIAMGFVFLSVIHFFGQTALSDRLLHSGYHVLFHSFHYLHVVVAVAGAMIAFFRYSNRLVLGIFMSCIVSPLFCVLSDVVLPSFAARILGVSIPMHICFLSAHDAANWYAFMIVGAVCGAALLHNKESLKIFSLTFHFFHILISSMAAMFYIVSQGFDQWYDVMGGLFLFLFIAVIVPCTLSDVVVPFCCSRLSRK